MEMKDLIFPADFLNLTKEDTDKIIKELELDITDNVDIKSQLFSIKDQLFEVESISSLIKSKILAGKTSIKWYKIEFEDEDINNLISKLESQTNFFDVVEQIDTTQIISPRKYTCIKIGNNTYMMRIMTPTGTKTVNNGREIRKIQTVNNITVIVNLEGKYIEIRSDSASAKKIINNILKPLLGKEIREVNVIAQYHDCLETFRDSLNNGKFIDVISKPALNLDLTREQNDVLLGTLKAIDEYFINKDIDSLKDAILAVNLGGGEDIPFTQLFLAGLSQIGMATRNDIREDLSSQSLYGILKSYMTSQSGYISFTLDVDEEIPHFYTILVGIKTTNSITFRSSSTEQAINYIRSKILG